MDPNIKNITKEMAQEIVQGIAHEVSAELSKCNQHQKKLVDVNDLLVETNVIIKSARFIESYLTTIKGCADGIENILNTASKEGQYPEEPRTLLSSTKAVQEDADLAEKELNNLKSALLNIIYIFTLDEQQMPPEEE